MPAITQFATRGDGPVFAGKIFPFAFITIACGAISGFHALISSGTTPKLLARESQAREAVGLGRIERRLRDGHRQHADSSKDAHH